MSFPFESSTVQPKNSKTIREIVMKILTHRYLIEKTFGNIENDRELIDCIERNLNITSKPASKNIPEFFTPFPLSEVDGLRLKTIYNFIVDKKCKTHEIFPKNVKNFDYVSRGVPEKEINCMKIFLSTLRPHSEALKGFKVENFKNLNCEDPFKDDPKDLEAKIQKFNALKLKNCNLENFFNDREIKIDISEFLVMTTLQENSFEKLKEKNDEMRRKFEKFTDDHIECVMKEFDGLKNKK